MGSKHLTRTLKYGKFAIQIGHIKTIFLKQNHVNCDLFN